MIFSERTSVMASEPEPLETSWLNQLRKEFYENPKYVLAQNACTNTSSSNLYKNWRVINSTSHFYNHKIDFPTMKSYTSTQSILFSVMKHSFAMHLKMKECDFEFSETFSHFWLQMEDFNYRLHKVVEYLKEGRQPDDRDFHLVIHASSNVNWNLVAMTILKYGMVPKDCYHNRFSSISSLEALLPAKFKEFTRDLKRSVERKASKEQLKKEVNEMMEVVFKLLGIHLGIPPKTFIYRYEDEDKKCITIGPITPKQFYENYVKPSYNVEDKIYLCAQLNPSIPHGHLYTCEPLMHFVGGRRQMFNNQPIKTLVELVCKSIKENQLVPCECDFSQSKCTENGILHLDIENPKGLFDVEIPKLNRNDRSRLMETTEITSLIDGMFLDEAEKPLHWRLHTGNISWGKNGYICMTTEWFEEYARGILVDKKFVPQDIIDVFEQKPTVYSIWEFE